ncbi:flavin-containing monooxygenase [Nocardia mexicana]|uniref:Cation diffusion facilitator CzcD-associated flavoprotein CzcO n=1 Tax=Nocardia mexicana TaxID=279262 RepID=A0A370GGJ6_9NOCA|nr:NAD(P)/FAD-dependent oxidoreductase [Nocardia mexicana]RDI42787.1 cation diffusion facilitator CzcD-associated flavoprotein CzcO [Nocardia mexicana]
MNDSDNAVDYEVIIVGAGFSGIGSAIQLQKAGIHDFVILEKADDIGGTWRENTYPGVCVDVFSWGYCYAFEPNPNWQHTFARGHELKAYADHCVDKYGLRQHLRLNTEVTKAGFDEGRHLWRVDTAVGSLTSRFVMIAPGGFNHPKRPDIEGLDDFAGTVIHSARWDHDHDLTGERVAVIGTGASGVQLIPEVAKAAERLHVFQRTPIWSHPTFDVRIPRALQTVFRRFPRLMLLPRLLNNLAIETFFFFGIRFNGPWLVTLMERLSLAMLRIQVPDPRVRAALRPNYRFGCKFPALSNRYYRTFARHNVELVTAPIERITETGIVTTDGQHREIDTLVLATGFKIYERDVLPPFPEVGRDGVELGEFFEENRYAAYEGTSLPGWPNAWAILGPYAVTGSFFLMIDNSTTHAVRCILEARRRGATCVEVKQEPHRRFFEEMVRRQGKSLFYNSNCERAHSFYFDKFGDVALIRPSSGVSAWWRARHFPMDDYEFTSRSGPSER